MNTDACKPVGEGADAPNVRMDGKMTAPWMPPLPEPFNELTYHETFLLRLRQIQADAALRAIEEVRRG